ncbi:MAG TPA: trehalase family glycosidase, partial [Calditrichia bacterium]|nr:trehalase family glycosidase [Calditrichia bacterium]
MRTIQVHIEENLKNLLAREDTDGDRRITIQDHGPHSFQVRATDGNNYLVEGTYYLSNLLQELALLREGGQAVGELDPRHIFEKPVSRFSRMIREHYWDGLTRRLDAAGLEKLMTDSKSGSNAAPRVYVPYSDPTAQAYFRKLAASGAVPGLKVIVLPEKITPEYVRSINLEPGILSLQLRQNGEGHWEGTPFVVPGGRFNEMYGWDSYFEALGLIADKRVDLAKAMVDNFCYEITHYGQILNASRSYYLTRSQPPFLTDMALRVYHELPKKESSREWLAGVLRTAIREYHSVWMNPERLTETGLSRYYAYGIGITPETEEGHYDAVLRPFAQKAGMDVRGYAAKMLKGEIREPALDEYFLHDRAVRESGHDTSYRIEGRCAHLNTVDLNALLYRYETDLAEAIARNFDDALPLANGQVTRSAEWQARAKKRRELVDRYLWDGERGLY